MMTGLPQPVSACVLAPTSSTGPSPSPEGPLGIPEPWPLLPHLWRPVSSKEKAPQSVFQQTKGERSCVRAPGCPGAGTGPSCSALYHPLCLSYLSRGLLLKKVLSNLVHQKAELCPFCNQGICVQVPSRGASQPNPSTEENL